LPVAPAVQEESRTVVGTAGCSWITAMAIFDLGWRMLRAVW
jgi:hypothetical protein